MSVQEGGAVRFARNPRQLMGQANEGKGCYAVACDECGAQARHACRESGDRGLRIVRAHRVRRQAGKLWADAQKGANAA